MTINPNENPRMAGSGALERSLATARLAATPNVMPLIFFACFSGLLNFVSGLFLPERDVAAV
jgi:hypothetical protein